MVAKKSEDGSEGERVNGHCGSCSGGVAGGEQAILVSLELGANSQSSLN